MEVNQSNNKLQTLKNDQNPASVSKSTFFNRASGVILLVFLFGILWIYGWAGEIRYASATGYYTSGLKGDLSTKFQTQTLFGSLYVIDTIFVVIGFGLLFSYFNKSTTIGLFTSIFIVSFTVLSSPIFSKFWFNVFFTNFNGQQLDTTKTSRFYYSSLGGLNIYLDYYNLRIALANSISQLVVYLALFGRLNIFQVIFNTLLFNFAWNFNHFLCAYLNQISPDPRFFDDYQISNVYLFAATYGFIASLILKKHQISYIQQFRGSKNSSILAQLGTFFLFLSFCATTTMFSLKYDSNTNSGVQTSRSFIWQQAFISIFISMSASIIFNYAFSILFNPNTFIGIRGSLVGTISGAIMYGSVAGTSINIGAAIAVGLCAGFISALFFEKIYLAFNKSQIKDSFGGLSFLFVSFIGTFLIAPTVLKAYYNYDVTLQTLSLAKITNKDVVGWTLVNVGISIGIGLIGGLIIGGILRCFQKTNQKVYDDGEIFNSRYGLAEKKKQQKQQKQVENIPSAQHLQE